MKKRFQVPSSIKKQVADYLGVKVNLVHFEHPDNVDVSTRYYDFEISYNKKNDYISKRFSVEDGELQIPTAELKQENKYCKVAEFTKEQWVEALTQETTQKLWGEPTTFTPVICTEKVGDGEQLIFVESLDMRPMHWLIFIDSKSDLSDIDIEDFLQPLEECFGRHPYDNNLEFRNKDEFDAYLKNNKSWECNYDTYEEYLSACEYPSVLWQGGKWGMIANFRTGEYDRYWLEDVKKHFNNLQHKEHPTMRKIKFRAWNKQYKEMHSHKELTQAVDMGIIDESRIGGTLYRTRRYDSVLNGILKNDELADRYVLMQFTGLQDKNGKEIYEGDIVTMKGHEDEKHWTCAIYYSDGRFQMNKENNEYFIGSISQNYILNCGFEVIGNIHDSPELLTRKKEDIDFINKITENKIMVGNTELSFKQKKQLAEKKYLKVQNVQSPKNRTATAILTLNEKGELNTEYHPLKKKKILNMRTKSEVKDKTVKIGM
jgi:uncharacterized phage protein (TIGR01671 family)